MFICQCECLLRFYWSKEDKDEKGNREWREGKRWKIAKIGMGIGKEKQEPVARGKRPNAKTIEKWNISVLATSILLAISRQGNNQFEKAICHSKALNIF
jgi:hypothetical protein